MLAIALILALWLVIVYLLVADYDLLASLAYDLTMLPPRPKVTIEQ